MLRSVIVSADRELASYLDRVLSETAEVSIVGVVDHHANPIDLGAVLRLDAPEVMFVCLESPSQVTQIIAHAEQVLPGIQTVVIGRCTDPQTLMEVMDAGIREFLASPLQQRVLLECLQRLKKNLYGCPSAVCDRNSGDGSSRGIPRFALPLASLYAASDKLQ